MTSTPSDPQPQPAADSRWIPFSFLWPILAGVLAGLVIRLVFSGKAGQPFVPMMGAFIYLSPVLVGAVTVYVAELRQRRGVAYYFWAPFFANVLYVVGALIINVEGWICAILIVPMFALIGGIGGLVMGLICRVTHWPKQATYSFVALPLLLGAFEQHLPLPERIEDVQRSVVIAAPADEVWRQIQHADRIRADEVRHAWMYRIGVPLPQAGVTENTGEGLVRRITMGKGIHFDQVVTDWQPARYVRFEYRFAPDSFPPRALDDHVMIGGHYFDLVDTSYTLTPRGGTTELTVRMRYRVSTQFNWYADPIARWLIGDFEDTILDFYRHRSESVGTRQAQLTGRYGSRPGPTGSPPPSKAGG